MILGAGWYAGHSGMCKPKFYGSEVPKCKFCLCLQHDDGTNSYIKSDELVFATNEGPILYNDNLMGEIYDARRPSYFEIMNGEKVKFTPAIINTNLHLQISPFLGEPIRQLDTLNAVSIVEQSPNTYIVDFGQNSVGLTEIKISAERGTQITIRHGEILYPDGRLYTKNLRTAKATDVYITRGNQTETYTPTFTYHGFRYAEISASSPFTLISAHSRVIATDLRQTGFIQTSSAMVNKLLNNAFWGQRCNHFSIPTDCPQRDERLGWLGDVQIFARSGAYQMDTLSFLKKWLLDVRDAILPDGSIPDVCPDMYHFSYGTAAWADAIAIVPQTLYEMYGDIDVIESNFNALKNWVDYCIYTSDNFLRPAEGYGDWLNNNDETDKQLISTAYFHNSVLTLLKWIQLLKYPDESYYASIAAKIRNAFQKKFLIGTKLVNDSQTAYILSLKMKMFENPELNKKLAERLAKKILERDGHLSCGFLGVGSICPVLTDYGYHQIAYTLLLNKDYPSWGYSVINGATTIWERWNSWSSETGFGNPEMNSYNHYAFGSIVEWIYAYAAGIRNDPSHPGFKEFIFSPFPDARLPQLHAQFDSAAGSIQVNYCIEEEKLFKCSLTVPKGVKAKLNFPYYLTNIKLNNEDAPEFLTEGTHSLSAEILES